jgi:hypothetical protein
MRRASISFAIILGFCPHLNAADDLALRRQQIANLSLTEQQQLLRNQQRFDELSTADRERMRKLYADLQADPHRPELQKVLDRYYEWLKTLSPEHRAELEDMEAGARIKRIRELVTREREEHNRRRPRFGGEPIPKEDLDALYKWFSDLVWQRRDDILAEMPESRRKQIAGLDESMQRKSLLFAAIQRNRADQLPIEDADYERLLKKLSPETRDKLARAPSPQQKKRLARGWLGQAMMMRMGSHSMRRAMATISGDELQRFFEKLPESDRSRLMGMPPDQMQQELKHLYFQRVSRPDGPPPLDPPFGHRGPHGAPEHRRPDRGGPPDRGPPDREHRPGGPGFRPPPAHDGP